jgi:peptidyl-prolyl cis-trans isomerase SurA
MKVLKYVGFVAICVGLWAGAAFAQETETKVIDEVVAQVNDGVITLSGIRREMKEIVDSKVQEGMKREDAEKLVAEKQGELIANLINEELLIQKAKELGIGNDVEADINGRFVQIMKQYNMKTLDALYVEMNKQGVDPQALREVWRKQATRDRVLQREVQSKIYWTPTGKDLKEYFEKNKSRFTKAESVTMSEIFLKFAGKDETALREKAKKIVADVRGGLDFTKAVAENSEGDDIAKTKGSLGTASVKDLETQYPAYAKAISGVKVGGVAEPFDDDIGIHIVHVDDRSAASTESVFDEEAVRVAVMKDKLPEAQKTFLAKLREDALIKINDTYRPLVSPILFADERKTKTDK